MKNRLLNSLFILLFIASLLFGCAGKQGDPGIAGANGTNGTNGTNGKNGSTVPDGSSGAFQNGAFKGIVQGTLQNGTTFKDSINYQYAPGYEYFNTIGNTSSFDLTRYQFSETTASATQYVSSPASLYISLSVSNLGGGNQTVDATGSQLSFSAPFATDQLISLFAEPSVADITAVYPIDPNSKTYLFQSYNTTPSFLPQSSQNDYDSVVFTLTKFITKTGDTVYYDNPETGTGSFIKIVSSQGVTATTSAAYGAIHLVAHRCSYSGGYVIYYFTFADVNNIDLSKTVQIQNGPYAVSNLVYDKTTAVLTFDFSLTYSIFANSTGNPLTVSGKFSGSVYQMVD